MVVLETFQVVLETFQVVLKTFWVVLKTFQVVLKTFQVVLKTFDNGFWIGFVLVWGRFHIDLEWIWRGWLAASDDDFLAST